MGVQNSTVWVDEHRKQGKEGQKGPHTSVENIALLHFVCKGGVDSGETDGSGQVDISLNERDHFGSTLWGSDHQYVLSVSQDGVVEQNSKEHQGEGNQLFAFLFRWDDRFDLRCLFCFNRKGVDAQKWLNRMPFYIYKQAKKQFHQNTDGNQIHTLPKNPFLPPSAEAAISAMSGPLRFCWLLVHQTN